MEKLRNEFTYALENQILKKAVFSKPEDKSELKTVLTPFINKGELCVKKETFLKDGKAIQKILSIEEASAFVHESATSAYRQINLVGENKTLLVCIKKACWGQYVFVFAQIIFVDNVP